MRYRPMRRWHRQWTHFSRPAVTEKGRDQFNAPILREELLRLLQSDQERKNPVGRGDAAQ